MVREKKSVKAILAALKIEMAQPHITASALAALYPDAELQKLILSERVDLHRRLTIGSR
jgi:hypothetical protein